MAIGPCGPPGWVQRARVGKAGRGNECRARSAGCSRANPGSGRWSPWSSKPRTCLLLTGNGNDGWNQISEGGTFRAELRPEHGRRRRCGQVPIPDVQRAEATVRTKRIEREEDTIERGLPLPPPLLLLGLRSTPEHLTMITFHSTALLVEARHQMQANSLDTTLDLCSREGCVSQQSVVGACPLAVAGERKCGVYRWCPSLSGVVLVWVSEPLLPQPAKQSPQNGRSVELPSRRRTSWARGAGMAAPALGVRSGFIPFLCHPNPIFLSAGSWQCIGTDQRSRASQRGIFKFL